MLSTHYDCQLYISDSSFQSNAYPLSAPNVFPLADGGYHRDVRDRIGAVQSHEHVTAALCCGSGHRRLVVCCLTALSVAVIIRRR
jgi:hypothetical protein